MNKKMIVYAAIVVILLIFFGNAYYCRKSASTKKPDAIFHANIISAAKENNNFRNVLATASHGQVVLMSILSGETIGKESHDVDQFLMFTQGSGKAIINEKEYAIAAGDLFLVPAGAVHDFINTGKEPLKLFTIYAPSEHEQGLVQKTKPARD